MLPPSPRSFRGRTAELRTLEALVRARHPSAVALVGGGGSGKTTLAIALAHRLRGWLRGRVHWIRIGAWDVGTIAEMMALELGARGERPALARVRTALSGPLPSLVVLDNHESDEATAQLLRALGGLPVTWVLTARRCLLGGVTIFPVVPPLVTSQKNPFPAIPHVARLLRHHPVALDVADALVTSGAVEEHALVRRLQRRGVTDIVPVEHEDDVPEVAAIVAEAIGHLGQAERRMLGVLASMGGDAMDGESLLRLARAERRGPAAIARLGELRLVQRPAPDRYTLHATVRHAVRKSLPIDELAVAVHYLTLLERSPDRVEEEQTHLFALMDWAQREGRLDRILRVHALAERRDRLAATAEATRPGKSTAATVGRSRRATSHSTSPERATAPRRARGRGERSS